MIQAFPKSRAIAWLGGILLGAGAAAAIWLLMMQSGQTAASCMLSAALAAFVGVNIAVYVARMVAMREYQTRLLYLYEDLDPQKALDALQPLRAARMDAATRGTLLAHLANAQLYAGEPAQALATLQETRVPEKALAMRGLLCSNSATCLIAQGEFARAQECMMQLRAIIADKACKKEFVTKARHTLAYLQLCMDIAQGKRVETAALEKDFAASRAPLHRLDVQYRLARAYCRDKDADKRAQAVAYVREHGGKTALPGLLG